MQWGRHSILLTVQFIARLTVKDIMSGTSACTAVLQHQCYDPQFPYTAAAPSAPHTVMPDKRRHQHGARMVCLIRTACGLLIVGQAAPAAAAACKVRFLPPAWGRGALNRHVT